MVPYGGVPFWHLESGLDVAVARFPVSPTQTLDVVALLGVSGTPLIWYVGNRLGDGIETMADLPLRAFLELYLACSAPSADIRWPRREGDRLMGDRRRDRRIQTELHPKSFQKEYLGLPPEASLAQYHAALNERLADYAAQKTVPPEEAARLYAVARWNVPLRHYGEATPEQLHLIAEKAVTWFWEMGLRGEALGDELRKELDACRATEDLPSLAAWHESIVAASQGFHEARAEYQRRAYEDMLSQPGQLPSDIARAVGSESVGLHELLYTPHPHFGFEAFDWAARGGNTVNLRLPLLVASGRLFLGTIWWEELVGSYATREDRGKAAALDKFASFCALVAAERMAGGDEGDVNPNLTLNDDSEVDEIAAPVIEPEPDRTRLFSAIADALPDREWRILYLIERDGIPASEVAAREGISTGRVSQLLRRAKDRIQANPDLLALYLGDEPRERP